MICVLGCRATSATLARRARAAAEIFHARRPALVVACGGRAWDGIVEADQIAKMLVEGGVPSDIIVRERCSLDTFDNARFAAALLRRRGLDEIVLVTCSWHMPRAAYLFEQAGLRVEEMGVHPPDASPADWAYFRAREAVSTFFDKRRRVRLA
ncbi:Putative membrane protein [Labilithrix luteola]|uniref:Putative membrane protein n=1 Tax=Labilithrix luteola TaxID=1391654 RepID=A0A0K1PVB1_9BACT|nr:Putative membrane protein [Labilithrix luteola]